MTNTQTDADTFIQAALDLGENQGIESFPDRYSDNWVRVFNKRRYF